MENRSEKLYYSPADFPQLADGAAIQAAINAAAAQDIWVVSIRPKENGDIWKVTEPIQVPSYMTVIVDGTAVASDGVIFESVPGTRTLGGERRKIFLLGRHGGKLVGTGAAPQIALTNARDCRVADLAFEGGAGVALDYVRYSKFQCLRFANSSHALTLAGGCNNLIVESVSADTKAEAILAQGGGEAVMGRRSDVYNSIFCRILVKVQNCPAVAFYAGGAPLYNLVLRDVTDATQGPGATVVIGRAEDAGLIRDLTVRGVDSGRTSVETGCVCDGMFFSNLRSPAVLAQEHTRSFFEDETMDIVLPQFAPDKADRPFLTPNDPAFFGADDSETIQNAVDAAQAQGLDLVVIPRFNVRTQKPLWDLPKAVRMPNCMTVVFLAAQLRQADFCYENMFINALAYDGQDRTVEKEQHDLGFIGVGDAVLDGGKPNGLLEKTCNLYGLPDKRPNATLLFNNVRNMVLENFQIRQSRWYGTYFIHCDTVRVSGLDFDNWEDCCNRDGVDVRSGCHNFLIENITGTTGDDTVALNNLGNDGNDGRYVQGKDPDTLHMVMRNIKADAGRWFTVRLLCQDRHLEQDFTLDTIMDVSESENKKGVGAAVMIGSHEYHYKIPAELGDMAHLKIRDVYSRSPRCLAFGGCSDDVQVSNCHIYGDGYYGVSVRIQARLRDVRVSGVFYKREHKRLFVSGTADTVLPGDRPEGTVIDMPSLETQGSVVVENVFADSADVGVRLTGSGSMEVKNFRLGSCCTPYLCGENCTLSVNGEAVAPTPPVAL